MNYPDPEELLQRADELVHAAHYFRQCVLRLPSHYRDPNDILNLYHQLSPAERALNQLDGLLKNGFQAR